VSNGGTVAERRNRGTRPARGVSEFAAYPGIAPGATPPVWLARAAELFGETAAAGATAVKPIHSPDELYGCET
jgi:hypothetical protein